MIRFLCSLSFRFLCINTDCLRHWVEETRAHMPYICVIYNKYSFKTSTIEANIQEERQTKKRMKKLTNRNEFWFWVSVWLGWRSTRMTTEACEQRAVRRPQTDCLQRVRQDQLRKEHPPPLSFRLYFLPNKPEIREITQRWLKWLLEIMLKASRLTKPIHFRSINENEWTNSLLDMFFKSSSTRIDI